MSKFKGFGINPQKIPKSKTLGNKEIFQIVNDCKILFEEYEDILNPSKSFKNIDPLTYLIRFKKDLKKYRSRFPEVTSGNLSKHSGLLQKILVQLNQLDTEFDADLQVALKNAIEDYHSLNN